MEKYFALVKEFPLRPIRNERELSVALSVVDRLLAMDLSDEESDYLDVLSDLIEKYEHKTVMIPSPSDREMLKHLLEVRNISQVALSKETKISASTISSLLSGKRPFTRGHIKRLCLFFNVEPGVFTDSWY